MTWQHKYWAVTLVTALFICLYFHFCAISLPANQTFYIVRCLADTYIMCQSICTAKLLYENEMTLRVDKLLRLSI